MYEEFYGLRHRPFLAVPSRAHHVVVPSLQTVTTEVEESLEHDLGVIVLLGEPGLGKSQFCQSLAGAHRDRFRSAYLSTSAFHTRRGLLQAILFELGLDYAGLTEQESRLRIIETARSEALQLRSLLIIVDEAHLLGSNLLEEIRQLSEHTLDGRSIIRLVLAGNPELEDRLADPAMEALHRRIVRFARLEPFSKAESTEYLEALLVAAGAGRSTQVFTQSAIEAICQASDGVPRCLNQLADHTLLRGYAEEIRPIPRSFVREALRDLRELPLHWNELHADEDSTDYDDSADESASAAIHIEDDPCIVVDHVTEFSPRSTEVAVDPALRETDEFDIPTNAEDEAVLDPTNPTPHPRPIAPESAQLTDDGYVVFEVGCGVEQPESAKHVPEMAEETTLNHSLDPHQGEAELSGEQPTDESIDEVSKEIFVDDPYASLDAEREGSRLPSVKTPSAPQAETVELPEERDETSLEQQLLETVEDLRCEVQAATDDDLPGPIEFPTEEPVEYDVVYPSEVDNVLDEPTVDVPEPSSESDEEEPWVANLEVPDGDEPTTVEASADLQDTGQETAEPEDHFLTLPEMLGSDAADVASIETDEPLDDDAVTHRLAETLDSTTSPRRRYAQLFTRLRERRRAHARVQRAG